MTLYRDFQTPAEIDAEYNPEIAVPDFMATVQGWLDASARARSRLNCRLGLRYGPTLDEYVDVFPADRPNAPVLLFLHGGYWRILSAREFSFCALGPVAAGVTVMVVNYALTPKVTVDEITRQACAAVAWAHRHARAHNGNPGRIYFSGHSVGGQMTGMALLTDWSGEYGLPGDVLKGGFAISGLFDLRPLPHSFIQDQVRLTPDQVERQSPALHIRPVPGRMVAAYGGAESAEFRRQSEDFIRLWHKAGNAGRPLPLPGCNHFTVLDGFMDPDSILCQTLFRLMGHGPSPALAGSRGLPGTSPFAVGGARP